MSVHAVKVVQIEEVRPHANADRLELVTIGGWQAVIRKGDFKTGDLAIYIEPDYMVPTDRPEFAFLAKEGRTQHRLKAIRLRGEMSYGLLIHLPEGCDDAKPGDDVMEMLGITRYVPKTKGMAYPNNVTRSHDKSFWPTIPTPVFGLDNIKNYAGLLSDGDLVVMTEKIHGANARYLFSGGKFHIGSRTRWTRHELPKETFLQRLVRIVMRREKPQIEESVWKKAAERYPQIREWCMAHPDTILIGEVFGITQSLHYGQPDDVDFAAFAAQKGEKFINTLDLFDNLKPWNIPTVPVLYAGPFSLSYAEKLAEQDSTVPGAEKGHMREGVVITPIEERRDPRCGRVSLKMISNRYWEAGAEV